MEVLSQLIQHFQLVKLVKLQFVSMFIIIEAKHFGNIIVISSRIIHILHERCSSIGSRFVWSTKELKSEEWLASALFGDTIHNSRCSNIKFWPKWLLQCGKHLCPQWPQGLIFLIPRLFPEFFTDFPDLKSFVFWQITWATFSQVFFFSQRFKEGGSNSTASQLTSSTCCWG